MRFKMILIFLMIMPVLTSCQNTEPHYFVSTIDSQSQYVFDFEDYADDTVYLTFNEEIKRTVTFKNIDRKIIVLEKFVSLVPGQIPSIVIEGYVINSKIIGFEWKMNSDLVIDCAINNLIVENLRSSGAKNGIVLKEHKHEGFLGLDYCSLNNTIENGFCFLPEKYLKDFFIFVDKCYFGNIGFSAVKVKNIDYLRVENSHFFEIGLKNNGDCAIMTSNIVDEEFDGNHYSVKKKFRECVFFDY